MSFAETEDLKLGKVMQPVRAAITGGKQYGDLVEALEILGKDEVIARLSDVS
jgi:glutamyl-tRNA synthetase